MELIRCATLTVADLDRSVALYRDWLDYTQVEAGAVPADLAASWGAPASAGARYAVMRPASGADVFLRFVQQPPVAGYRPLRTHGWAAIEICTKDTHAVNARMEESPFEIIGPPKELDGLPAIFPMQVKGPDQEIVYLTQIRDNLPAYDLPRAAALIDKLFILVLASSDMRRANAWIADRLGFSMGREMEIEYTMIADAFGLPRSQKHRLSTMIHERDCFLEVDQYPDAATPRPRHDGQLPPGCAVATFAHPDFGSVCGDWITPPAPRDGVVYGGKRAGTLRDPDGTLFEVVEL